MESSVGVSTGTVALRLRAHGDVPLIGVTESLDALTQTYIGLSLMNHFWGEDSLGARPIIISPEHAESLLNAWRIPRFVVRADQRTTLQSSSLRTTSIRPGTETTVAMMILQSTADFELDRVSVASPGFIQIKGIGKAMEQLRLLLERLVYRRQTLAQLDIVNRREELKNMLLEEEVIARRVAAIEDAKYLSKEEKRQLLRVLLVGPVTSLDERWEDRAIESGSAELVEANEPFPDEA